MSRDRPEPDPRLEALTRRLEAVERRLAGLESRIPAARQEYGVEAAPAPSLAEAAAATPLRAEYLPLIGRTLLVVAGAFLLRAVTESGTLPQRTGTALGIAYAVVWLVLAARAARFDRRNSATFHGVAAAIVAFPLIWEATVKFAFLSPVAGAAVLVLFTGMALGLATWQRLRRVASIMGLGAAATALVLAVGTKMLTMFIAVLVLLGFATLWLGFARGWRTLGWIVAAVADLAVLFATGLVLAGRAEQVWGLVHPESVITLQLALVLVYCGSLGARTLARGVDVSPGEIAQGVAAVVVGLGGSLAVTRASGYGVVALGAVSLTLAAGCYGAAFMFIDRRSGGRRNFVFYTTLALLFALVAFSALLRDPGLTVTLSGAAVLTAWLGAVRERQTLSLHGAVYAIAATATSGLLVLAVEALTAAIAPRPGRLAPVMLLALAATLACCVLRVASHGRTWGTFSRVPKLAILVVLALGVDGTVVILAGALLPDGDGASLAALRTGVLAATAVLVGAAGRTDRCTEAHWLVYPVLIAGGAKLLIEDVAAGRAATLVLSFALYGGALIVAPRLARRTT